MEAGKGKIIAGLTSQFYHRSFIIEAISIIAVTYIIASVILCILIATLH